MRISGSWSLVIGGNQVDFDEVRAQIGIEASRITRKGEIKSKVVGPSQRDIWVYEQIFNGNDEVIMRLEDLLVALESHKSYIKELANTLDVVLKLYVQSDYAQIGISLPPESINKIATMNLKVEISIFSWGGVDNDNNRSD